MDYGEQFWKWFNENEGELFDFEVDKERIFDRLASQLRKVDPNLTFEFGPKQAGKREFIVSAGGVKRAFAAVTSLIAKAPNLNRWRITGFRPRRGAFTRRWSSLPRSGASVVWLVSTSAGGAVKVPWYRPAIEETGLPVGDSFLPSTTSSPGRHAVACTMAIAAAARTALRSLSPLTTTRPGSYGERSC